MSDQHHSANKLLMGNNCTFLIRVLLEVAIYKAMNIHTVCELNRYCNSTLNGKLSQKVVNSSLALPLDSVLDNSEV